VGEQIEKLAQFIARTGWDDMPGAVHRRAKLVLLDTIGVTLAGAARPEVIGLRERLLLGAGRGATVLAAGLPQADIRTAALLNGIAARSVELCEGANGLQPSPHILPGVLAIAEQRGLGGRAMLGAFVLGYEVAGRLNRVYTQRAFSHPNGQLSLLGAAAAGARLHELDGAGISLAMRVATSMLMTPSYNNTVAGGTTLNLPAGLAAVAATLAPDMAAAGYAAQEDAIEEALGVMVGAGFAPEKLPDDMGRRWEIVENYFRFYACCNPIHAALDSLAETLAVLKPRPQEVARVEVQTFAFASVMRIRHRPTTSRRNIRCRMRRRC
jgi:2-methylcitrate dehydratase PrpD